MAFLRRHATNTVSADTYAESTDLVPSVARMPTRLPSPASTGLALGVGRTLVGSTFLLAPGFSTRLLGLDAGTANRVVWLSRMAAARDIGLGVGTVLSALRGRDSSVWVAAGAAADAVDAVVVAQAVQQRRLGGINAMGMVGVAGAAAAVGLWAAWGTRRR